MYGQDGASTLMSIRDAARASGLSPKALRRRIERGTLGSVLVGGRRRIPVDDLVRRGLVADGSETASLGSGAEVDDAAALARRLRALEARVAALESALERGGSPGVGSGATPVLIGDGMPSLAADLTPARVPDPAAALPSR